MHAEAYDYIRRMTFGQKYKRAVEFGSRNVNGSVRRLVHADGYWGIDLKKGPDVDEVADAATWTDTENEYDLVICCETLEHAPSWAQIIRNAARHLTVNGVFLMTCAGPGRAPHSAIDGGPLRRNEYYWNLSESAFREEAYEAGFHDVETEYHERRGDLYARCVLL